MAEGFSRRQNLSSVRRAIERARYPDFDKLPPGNNDFLAAITTVETFFTPTAYYKTSLVLHDSWRCLYGDRHPRVRVIQGARMHKIQ